MAEPAHDNQQEDQSAAVASSDGSPDNVASDNGTSDTDAADKETIGVVDENGTSSNGSEDVMMPVEDPGPPPEVTPIFLSGPTQKIYSCVSEEDVTELNPMKMIPLETIRDDLQTRRAVCDFAPFKSQIQKYTGDSVLVVLDAAFEHGENFFTFLTEEDKQQYLKTLEYQKWLEYQKNPKRKKKDGEEGHEDESSDDDDDEPVEPPPPRPPKWVSLGSEAEVIEEQCNPTRPPIRMIVSRRRRYFGAPLRFTDRPNDVLNEDGENITCAEFSSVEMDDSDDAPSQLMRSQIHTGCQAVLMTTTGACQTTWPAPKNVGISCHITTEGTKVSTKSSTETQVSDDATQAEYTAEKLDAFLSTVYPRVRDGLVENSRLELFQDDFAALKGDRGTVFVGRSDSNLQEFQSYKYVGADFEQTLPCAAWHPQLDDVIAVSCARRVNLDERITFTLAAVKSIVTVWNLKNPIEPQLILEAPDDVVSLAFNPKDPHLLAGGCVNGQVLIWNLGRHAELLDKLATGKSSIHGDDRQITRLSPIASSSIEHGHSVSVSDVVWLPPENEISRNGSVVQADDASKSMAYQLMTVAADTSSLVWDLRYTNEKDKKDKTTTNVFARSGLAEIDLVWRPLLKIYVGLEAGLDNSGRKVSIRTPTFLCREDVDDDLRTKMFVGTERGNVVYLDWRAPESDSGKIGVQTHERAFKAHCGPIVALCRSPFLPSLLLSVGGQTLCLWHERNKEGPLLTSSIKGARATAGEWSYQRPGVFFIGKSDGTVDVWDLMDSSYAPVVVASVSSPVPVRFLRTKEYSNDTYNFMAACDDEGVLHVIELPMGLTVPVDEELERLKSFIDGEFKRLDYVSKRIDFRNTTSKKTVDDSQQTESDSSTKDVEEDLTGAFNEYLASEKEFLISMGLLKAEEPNEEDA